MDITYTACAPVSTFAVLFRGIASWSCGAMRRVQQVSCRTCQVPWLRELMLSRASAGSRLVAMSYQCCLAGAGCCRVRHAYGGRHMNATSMPRPHFIHFLAAVMTVAAGTVC